MELSSDVAPETNDWAFTTGCVNTESTSNGTTTWTSTVGAKATATCSAPVESIGMGASCKAEAGSTYVSGCETLLGQDYVTNANATRDYSSSTHEYLGTKQYQGTCLFALDDALNDKQDLIDQALQACEGKIATGPNTDEASGYCCVPVQP